MLNKIKKSKLQQFDFKFFYFVLKLGSVFTILHGNDWRYEGRNLMRSINVNYGFPERPLITRENHLQIQKGHQIVI